MTHRVLVVDDEALARARVSALVGESDAFQVVGECDRGDTAVREVTALVPDVVFLDIQMPGLDGFGVLDAVLDVMPPATVPVIVFVTAFDQYAVRAFEANALDYLQKPVARGRLSLALARAQRQLELRDLARSRALGGDGLPDAARVATLRSASQVARGVTMRFAVRRGGAIHFVNTEDVDWIDAAGNYVRLHAAGTVYMLRGTIADVVARLDPRHFVRVHRSTIVNLRRIARVESFTHGEYVLVATDGARLRSSRAHSARLRELIHSGMD